MVGGIRSWLGRALVRDAAKYISAPEDISASGSLLAKASQVAHDLNAIALDQPVGSDLAPIDNSHEDPKDAQLRLEFALGERLSLDFAYREVAHQPRIIPLLEEDNVVRHYQIIKLNSGHNGIVGNILIPDTKTDTQRIYVNFRGTQPHVLSSVHLNFEHCAGEESFYAHFDEIMGQIDSLVGKVSSKGKPVQLIFSGHSLGGALSQHAHFSAMLLSALTLRSNLIKEGVDHATQMRVNETHQTFRDYLAAKYKQSPKEKRFHHFDKVSTLVLNSWGMAGVSKTIECCSNELADVLNENAHKIMGRYGMNTLDVVPKCGEANTLSNCKGDIACLVIKDENLNVTRSFLSGCMDGIVTGTLFGGAYGAVMGASTALVKGLAPINAAHNHFHFGPYGELLAEKHYQTHRNTSEKGRQAIIDAFDNKLSILQKPLLIRAKSVLQKAGDVGASFKQTATVGIVSTLRTVYSVAPRLRKQ